MLFDGWCLMDVVCWMLFDGSYVMVSFFIHFLFYWQFVCFISLLCFVFSEGCCVLCLLFAWLRWHPQQLHTGVKTIGGGLLVILGKWMDQHHRPLTSVLSRPGLVFRAIWEYGSFQAICPQGLSLIWYMFPKPSGTWVISAMCPS